MKLNKAVLFDLDGTLVDSAPDIQAVINDCRKEQGLNPIDLEAVRPRVSSGSAALVSLLQDRPIPEAEQQPLKKQLLERYQAQRYRYLRFFKGMDALLQTLSHQGLTWGIVTNRYEQLTQPLIQRYPLLNQAHCFISGDTAARPKPHPDSLLLACERLQLEPSQALYIGDHEVDVLAARAAGIPIALVDFGYANKSAIKAWQPDWTFDQVERLKHFLIHEHLT